MVDIMKNSALAHLPVATVLYQYAAGELKILYLNPAALKLWNCTEEYAKNQCFDALFSAVHPDDLPLFASIEQACVHGSVEKESILFRLRHSNRILWIHMDLSAVGNEDGTVSIYTTMTDVTQSKELEHQLHTKEEEYRIVAEHNPSHLYRYNLKSKTLEIARNRGSSLQYDQVIEDVPDSLIKGGFVAPESITQVYDFFHAIHHKVKHTSQQFLCILDGVQKLFHTQYNLIDDVNGETTIAMGCFQDITGLKRRKSDALPMGENEKLFELVATHSKKHIFRFDHKTKRITSMQAEHIDTFIERMVPKFFNNNDTKHLVDSYLETTMAAYQRMLQGDLTGEVEYLVDELGDTRCHKAIFTNVFTPTGEKNYAVISFEDCTEERERAKAYALYQQEKASLSEADSLMEYNITQRKLLHVWGINALNDSDINAQTLLQTHLLQVAFPQDRPKVATFFDSVRMLDAFQRKVPTETLEHRITQNGEIHWMLTKVRYFQEPYSGDVLALISTSSIDEHHRALEQLMQANQLDNTTGLYNLQTFQVMVDEACDRATVNTPGSFIFISLAMENSASQQMGFDALYAHFTKCAKTLKTMFSNGELLGRLDGYQFGIYIEECVDFALLRDKLQLVLHLLEYRENDLLFVRPFGSIVMWSPEHTTTLSLWQTAAQCVAKERLGILTDHAPKAPHIPYSMHSHIVIRTFGFFDIFVDGQALHFPTAKAKELLAILVNRCGGYVNAAEGAMMLYEDDLYDERLKSKYRKVVMRLHEILRQHGIEDILGKNGGSRKLNTHLVNCDYYRYLAGGTGAEGLFNGTYMSNYSWGEDTLATLLK